MLGKTNTAPDSEDKGGGGEIIMATNKTNVPVVEGQKVWVNENIQEAGKRYNIEFNNVMAIVSYGAFIDRTGTFAWGYNSNYRLTSDSAIKIGDTSSYTSNRKYLRYGPENSHFWNDYRIDSARQYKLYGNYAGGNYTIQSSGLVMAVNKFNLENGEVIETYPWSLSNKQISKALFVKDNSENDNPSIYMWGVSVNKCFRFYVKTQDYVDYECSELIRPLAVTADNKFIIGYNSNEQYLRIVDITQGKPKVLMQSEMPEDLQEYYSMTPCFATFNQYTGILSITESCGYKYIVMRYSQGTWEKINISFPMAYNFYNPLTLSDDLSRCCIGLFNGSSAIIVNLTTNEGYIAQSYSPFVIGKNTITGYAAGNAEINEEVEVKTVTSKQTQ